MPTVSGSPTQIATYASDATSLAGTPDDQFKEGDLAWVSSLGRAFVLIRQTAPFASNNTTLISTFSTNGYWKIEGSPGEFWGSVTAWYIDAVNGDDDADGNTLTTPLQSFAELHRRLQGAVNAIAATVYVLSDIPNADPPRFEWLPVGSTIEVISHSSAVTSLAGPFALTAVSPINRAANTYPTITAATLTGNWQDYYGKAVRIVTANGGDQNRVGAIAQISADLGAKRARIIQFYSTTTRTSYQAAVGDTVEIVQLPVINTEPAVYGDPTSVTVAFSSLEFSLDYNYSSDRGSSGNVAFHACTLHGEVGVGGSIGCKSGLLYLYNSLVYAPDANYTELDVWSFASLYCYSSGFGIDNTFGSNAFVIDFGCAYQYHRDTLFQSGANVFVNPMSYMQIANVAVFGSTYRTFSFYPSSSANINYAPNVAYVYGTGNATPVFYIGPNVHISYLNTSQFVSTDTGAPGANPIEFVGYAQQTWANLAAGPGIAKTAAASDSQSTFTSTTML